MPQQFETYLLTILNDRIDELLRLGNDKQQELLAVINRLHINPDPNVYFGGKLQFNKDEYNADKGKILLFLLSNLPQNFTFNEPVIGIGNVLIGIRTIDEQLRKPPTRRLDVLLRRIIEVP